MQEVEDYFSQFKQEFPIDIEDFIESFDSKYDSKESGPSVTYTSRVFRKRNKSQEKAIEKTMRKVKKYIGNRKGTVLWRHPFDVIKETSFWTNKIVFCASCRFTFIPE